MEFFGQKLRHELKFYIHPHDYLALRQRVSPLLTLDSHSNDPEGYGIRSLYFDGPQDHCLYDKLNGIFSREKFRIRVYNGSDKVIKLERKSKYGDYVSKESARLSKSTYEQLLIGDASGLRQAEAPLLQDFYRAVVYRGFRPAVIVDYTREAYTYDYDDVRVTFDKKLSAGVNTCDLFHPGLVLNEAIPTERLILEVKFNRFLPDPVRRLIQLDAHNRSAISKYLICREVGLLHFKP